MIMKAAIGWVRDSKGRITKRTVKDVSNTITTFVGRGITGSDGLCSTKPYVLEIYGCCIKPNFGEDQELLEFIREYTPSECFRLMGCDDPTIAKLTDPNNGISKSQQYKMAGNSIVVDVLYHIFRKAFVETQNESRQLTIFD